MSAYVTPVSPATVDARKSASSVDSGRARKSMSLVCNATRANFAYAYASSTVNRPPASTPTPYAPSRARRSPSAAIRNASGHEASRSSPVFASRTIGAVIRSWVAYWNAQRPLSQFHSSFTAGSSPASRRITLPRRQSVRWAHPAEQCSHTLGVDTRSNGRARNRYCAPVSAPTGQICTVLPEKYELNGSSPAPPSGPAEPAWPGSPPSYHSSRYTLICSADERSIRSMNVSPAICSENRVHRWHSTHRSRSSSTWLDTLMGLGYSRLGSRNRLSGRPVDIAWFCSGHSPPLSHVGQSSGWLTRSSSIIPSWAFLATGEVSWVFTTIPSDTACVQEATGLRCPCTSTRHWRHAPAGSSSGWSQNRGISMPSCSQTRISRAPLGAVTSTPSMVSVTVSVALSTAVISGPPQARAQRRSAAYGPRCSPGTPA